MTGLRHIWPVLIIAQARYRMNIRLPLIACCAGLLWSVGGHAGSVTQGDALLLEFVQDMAWLEDRSVAAAADLNEQARSESTVSFFDNALARLNDLSPEQFGSLEQVSDAFTTHQKLVTQLAQSGQATSSDATNDVDLGGLETSAPKIHVRLENLTLNYLHIAQLVLFDELGNPVRKLAMTAQTKQRLLTLIARYPVDKQDADGYLSALWFIREGLNKWKCADEV